MNLPLLLCINLHLSAHLYLFPSSTHYFCASFIFLLSPSLFVSFSFPCQTSTLTIIPHFPRSNRHDLPPHISIIPSRPSGHSTYHQDCNITKVYALPTEFMCFVHNLRTNGAYFRKGKGKAIPLQSSTGPEGSRKLRLPDFKTIGIWR